MRLVTKLCCGALATALCLSVAPGVAQAQRLVVEEGPLTPDCPFGICPATNRPRSASDFYQLFGYLPPSSGVSYPGVPTTPPKSWPKTYYTPKPNHNPPTNHNPQANYAPTTPYVPKANVVPKKPMPKAMVTPAANSGTGKIASLSATDAARMKSELKDRNGKLLDKLTARVRAVVDEALGKLPASFDDKQKQELRDAIARGDAETVGRLLGDQTATPAGRSLTALATGGRNVGVVRSGVNDGNLGRNDLLALVDALSGVVPGDVLVTFGDVAVNQQVADWLDRAQPGPNLIPQGANVPIALIPGMQRGWIVPLGFGPTLIGMGTTIDTIILGEGNVLQAAGLPAPVGPPVPDFDGPVTAGMVVLTNVGEAAVNYGVNGAEFSMQPKFKQDLSGGESWTVDFDRGDGYGAAQYQLTEGWYEFTPTPKGWELFKKTFEIDLENGNDFDFHYVLDDQPRVLRAGRTDGLTGAFPPVIRFENADGKQKQKRLTDGKYRVALTAGTAVEVYPASSIPEPPKPEQFLAGAGLVSVNAPAASIGAQAAPVAASLTVATKPDAKAVAITLPPGFHPLDPVDLLTSSADVKVAKAKKVPPAFTMFAATERADGAN